MLRDKKIKKICSVGLILFSIVFLIGPVFVFAQFPGGTNPSGPGGTNPSGGFYGTQTWIMPNFLQAQSFEQMVAGIANWIFTLAIVAGVIVFIWTGIIFMTAGGDEKKLETAKRAMTYAVVGIAIALLAKGFVSLIQDIVGSQGVSTTQGVINALNRFANFLFTIAIPLAVIMVIYAGFLFMTAGGDEKKITTARGALIWALVGVAIVLASKGIIVLIRSLLGV